MELADRNLILHMGIETNSCDKKLQAYQNFKPNDEGKSLDETIEDTMKSFQTESFNPSVAQEADLDITDKENGTPQSLVCCGWML